MKQPIPFGKYFLLERVNVGGMAEVFKAKATGVEGFERLVAVKRILPSIAEDEEFITMFIDEAKIAVQLTHANIAQIFDLGRVDGSFFIALEYIHGKDMRAIFNRARQRTELLPVPMSCYIIMKLCEGLDYAHNKRDSGGEMVDLVHRDVSPQNILVSYEGEVKIIDFGIAKAAGKAGKTQAGILKGKFGYMSPEQVQGMEIDRRSDVFGVGICLYELLTGERLFVGESDFATLEKVRNVDIMPPSTYNRRVPEDLEQIVLKALARDRDERYQTALQLHDDLQSFMYTSGNFFSRKDLSLYMHRVFAEEIEKENVRDQEYASMDMPAEESESTGLHAFDEIEPVSTVSALNVQPGYQGHQNQQRSPSTPASSPSQPLPKKATLLGMPAASISARPPHSQPVIQSKIAVPGLVPRPQSIPPAAPRSGVRSSMPSAPSPSPAVSAPMDTGARSPGLDMDWDDEELSTQIYDKPDDLPLAAMARGPQPSATATGSLPPVLITTPAPGQGPVHPAFAQAQPYGRPSNGPPSGPPHAPRSNPAGAFTPPRSSIPPALASVPPVQHRADPTQTLQDEVPPWAQKRQGRPMLMAILAVVGIVAAIAVGLLVFGKPEPGTIHLATLPRSVLVTIDGRPASGRSSPFVLDQLPPGVTHEVEVSSPGFRPWSSKIELQPGQTMELPQITLERIESGFALDSVPRGADVYVDGRRITQPTPVRIADMEPGDHQIRLEHEGYAPWESALHVSPGTVLELQPAALKPLAAEQPKPAALAVPAVVGAAHEPRRASPPVVHVQRAVSPPSPAHEVEPATPAEPRASAGTGTLRINTRPWSKVFVDGKLIGNTPQMNILLDAGHHTVTLVNDDFGIKKTIKVEIKADEIETQVLTLTE